MLETGIESSAKKTLNALFREHMLKVKGLDDFYYGPAKSPLIDKRERFFILRGLISAFMARCDYEDEIKYRRLGLFDDEPDIYDMI